MNRTKSHTSVQLCQSAHPRSLSAMLLAAAFLLIAAAANAQVFSTPIDLAAGGPAGLPVIAVDSNNNIDVAWAASQGVVFTRSTDGGKSFTAPLTISNGTGSNRVQMSLDAAGGIYLLWQGSDLHFRLAHSADGRSFATPADLTAALAIGTFSGNLPRMALDTNGNVDLVWAQFGSAGSVLFSRSTDAGANFSAPVQLGSFAFGAKMQIAIGTSGVIYVLWTEQTTQAGDTCALRFNRSTDSGASFSPTLTLNAAGAECDARLALDSSGGVNVLSFDGNGTFYHSADGGNTFTNSQNVFLPATIWFGGQLNSNAGTIDAVLNSFPNHDVLFSKSANQGTSFSAPLLVSASHPAPSSAGAFGANSQSMGMDAAGNIDVIWEDDILNPGAPDIFFSRSTDAGGHFLAAQNISNNPGSGSPAMALDSAGNVNVVWAAANAGKVFFSRASASSSGGFTISGGQNSMTLLPGGTATTQLTLTAASAFNQSVSFACGSLPPGAQCSFSPASVTPGISGTTVTVAVSVPSTFTFGSFPFTVNASTPTISQFLNMQVTVGAASGSIAPSVTAIPLGGSANFAVTVVSTGNFAGQFFLNCSAPAGVTCTFTPNPGFLPINGRATAALNVQVASLPAAGSAPENPQGIQLLGPTNIVPALAFILCLLCAAAIAVARSNQRLALARRWAGVSLTIALAVLMLSCGGAVGTNRIGGVAATGATGAAEQGPSGSGALGPTESTSGTSAGALTPPGTTSVTFPLTVVAQSGGAVVNIATASITVP
ncbi:MAG TPA: sialidase family protein [Candidatus Acidoferrales bacterium]|nr:sialidase family protein [Candidatus Acidoferrales bacterium]